MSTGAKYIFVTKFSCKNAWFMI